MSVKINGFNDPDVQRDMEKSNHIQWDPHVDRNLLRKPERWIYLFSISRREFTIKRPPLISSLTLKACPADETYIQVARIPDPFVQVVHDVSHNRQRAELNDGMLLAIELLNPNNPTYDPDYAPPAEIAAILGSSKGCDLFAQGLFLSLDEVPSESEVRMAYRRRERYYRSLIAQADQLEAVDRKELEEFLRGEFGTDLRLALDHFGEMRAYHKPMIATRSCPNCGETVKANVAFHKNEAMGMICVIDWQRAVKAGVKTKFDVPADERWWEEEEDADEEAESDTPTAPVKRAPAKRKPRPRKTKPATEAS